MMASMNTPCLAPPTVPVSRKEKEARDNRLYLTESQRGALIQLSNLSNVFLHGADVRYGGIAARSKALLLGGTGTGKTSVARRFAVSRGWTFISFDSSGWVPVGAHAKPPTLLVLRDHVRRFSTDAKTPSGQSLHDQKGVICLDEIDKPWQSVNAVRDSSYSTATLSEVLAFLDADERLLGHQWTRQDIEKLKNSFFIIGAGSFQSYLREAEKKARGGALGFGEAEKGPQDFGQFISDIQALPDEIASRFAAPAIFLQAPTRKDFSAAIENIHHDLGVTMARPMDDLVTEAMGHLGGVRWLENYVTKLLVAHPPPLRAPESEVKLTPRGERIEDLRTFNFFAADTTEHIRKLNEDIFGLRVALAHVVSGLHLAVAQDRITQSTDNGFWIYLNTGGSFWEHTCETIATCGLCAEASSDTSHMMPLVIWEERAWKGIRDHANDLEKLNLLETWMRAWDLCSRVIQRQACLSVQVGRGT